MRVILSLAAALAAVPALSQGTVHGALVETTVGPYTAGATYEVALRLRADPSAADLGTSTFVLDFSGTATTFAAAPAEGPAGDYEFLAYQGAQATSTGGAAGYNSRVVRTNTNRLTVVVDLGFTSDGNGQALPSTLVDLVDLRFTVADPEVVPSFTVSNVQAYTGPGQPFVVGVFPFLPNPPTAGSPEAPPAEFALGAAYPNPFGAGATVPFDVAAPAHVEITAYDLLGRRVLTLVDGERGPGRYVAALDGRSLASGAYVIRAVMRPAIGEPPLVFTHRLTHVR